jgi:signal transduction histidine kinase
LKLRVARAQVESPEAVARLLDEALAELGTGLDELREIARGLHPAMLNDQGLARALEALVERLPVTVELTAPADRLPGHIEATAYYIVSEALTNVVKHAHAGRARVTVGCEAGAVHVEVGDDGRGGADTAAGSGIVGLRDRAEATGGTLTLVSPPGGGTVVTAALPLPREASAPPRPSSVISQRRTSRWRKIVTRASLAPACLATLVSASETM